MARGCTGAAASCCDRLPERGSGASRATPPRGWSTSSYCRPRTTSLGWWWTASTIPRTSWSNRWAKQLIGAELLRGSDHHGRRPRGADPGRAGNRPTFPGTGGIREQARGRRKRRRSRGPNSSACCCSGRAAFERLAVPLSLVARLEEFPHRPSSMRADARVVQYRNRILPLIPLRAVLGGGRPEGGPAADPAQVICLQRRRPQRGSDGRPDSGRRRRGGHGAPAGEPSRPAGLGGGGQAGSGISWISTT